MNVPDGKNRLLDSVLKEGAYQELREKTRIRCLREMAKRRKLFVLRRILIVAACLVATIGALTLLFPPRPGIHRHSTADRPETRPAWYVGSGTLRSGQLVRTRPMADVVQSAAGKQVRGCEPCTAAIVRSCSCEDVLLTDDELFTCFEGKPVALVLESSTRKCLVFLDPADRVLFYGQ